MALGQVERQPDMEMPEASSSCMPADECDQIPYFKGEGGFVGMATMGAEGYNKVQFVIECGSAITTVNDAMVGEDGVVVQGFFENNGLACMAGGIIRIHGLERGGWYWINGNRNAAVSHLLRDDTAGNAVKSAPVVPEGVTVDVNAMNMNASLLMGPNGIQGILPHIAAVPDPEPCMNGEKTSDCLFKPVYDVIAVTQNEDPEDRMQIGESIARAEEDIQLNIRVKGTGHLWNGMSGSVAQESQTAMIEPSVETVPPAAAPMYTDGMDLASHGLAWDDASRMLTIGGVGMDDDENATQGANFCTNDVPVKVTVKVTVAEGMNMMLFPEPGGMYMKTFMVTCP